MKIIFLLLSVCFFVSPVFAGGKGKSAPSSNDPAPPPVLPVVVVVEECVDIEEPALIIPSASYISGPNIGFMTCEGLIISAPTQSGSFSMVGTKMSRHCVKKGGK